MKNRIKTQLDKKEDLLNRLDRVLDWIKTCDTKASIFLAAIGIVVTIIGSEFFINKYYQICRFFLKDINQWKIIYLVVSITFLLLIIVGICSLIIELNPSLISKRNNNKEIDSLFFFGTIAKKKREDFKEEYRKSTLYSDIEDLLNQLYINSKICDLKYNYTKRGIFCSTIGIFGILVMTLLGVIILKLK